MIRPLRLFALIWLLIANIGLAEHVVVTGGPALRRWENLRVKEDQHDRWWANFVRASTLRMEEIRTAYGADAPVVWIVYRPGYETRGREDGKPYATWITQVAAKYRANLIWVRNGGELIQAINSRPRGSVQTFDYFGHSNRYCFMLDYGNEIMAVSMAWLHERDLGRIKSSVFGRNAYCKSWGCHTGESMSAAWKRAIGIPLEGANGATNYQTVSFGKLPSVSGSWVR
ncbi:MAG: hypothetical protein J0M04_23300 [Verrucomicrobia bacterium]|nr:hypothetical protein [Verrucomicrobiota bacterium]